MRLTRYVVYALNVDGLNMSGMVSPCLPSLSQHDLSHPTAAGALNAGDQFHSARATAATVMAYASDDVADQPGALRGVHLVDHPHLAAAVARSA
jgi:hypothetical protein